MLVRTVAPTALPVSVEEVRQDRRITGTSQDVRIAALIQAATERLDGPDGLLGRALVEQTWEWRLSCFPAVLRLPFGIVTDVPSISYVDTAGATVTLPTSAYFVRGIGTDSCTVRPAAGTSWPTTYPDDPEAVTIAFKAGYGEAADVPAPIRAAILEWVGTRFEHREFVVTDVAFSTLAASVQTDLARFMNWGVVNG